MAGDAKRRRMRRARAGYTLVEMLAALAVLSIMTVMVSTGVSAGVRAYERAQFTSQADMLSATINSSLDGAFRFMQNGDSTYSVTLDGHKVSFSKGSSALEVDDGKLCLADSSEGPVKLVNDGIYGMCVVDSVDQVECTMDNVEFSYVISNGASLSRAYSFVATPQRGVKRDSGVASGTGTSPGEGLGTADKTELGKEIALVEAIDLSGEETAAKEALKTALEAAKVVADKTDATQDEVDQATAELAAARRAYESSGSGSGFDYARLDAAIKSADDNAAWRTDGGTLAVGVQDAYAKATQARAGVGVTTQDEVTAAAIVLEDALSAFLSSKVLNVERINKAISDADAEKPWQSDSADAVSNLQSAYDAAKAALAAGESQEALDNAAAALESALAAYEDSLSSGGGEGGDVVFQFTIGDKTYSIPVVEYDGSGELKAGTVYSSGGTLYYANLDRDDPYNRDLATLSGWAYKDAGVTVVTANYVTAADFYDNNKCPSTISKGTMYYDEANNKLWTAHQDQAWLTRPDIDSSNWDDVSGMLV